MNSHSQVPSLTGQSRGKLGEPSGSARLAAFAVGALFAADTALTQSVSYIQGRSSSLCTLFFLASFYSYCAAAEHDIEGTVGDKTGKPVSLFAALRKKDSDGVMAGNKIMTVFRILSATVTFVLACMTKEIGVTLVAVLVIFEFVYVLRCRARNLRVNTILRLLPFALVLGSVFVARVLLYGAIGEVRSIREFWPNLLTQLSINVTYIRMLLLPIGLSIEHDYPIYHSLSEIRVIYSLALLCGLIVAAVAAVRRMPMFTFGFSWFLITLLPTTLIPIWDVISEHWLYLPSVGYFLMVGGLLENLVRRHLCGNDKKQRDAVAVIILVAIFLYGSGTILRNTVWRNGATLWADAVEKAPNRVRPRTNLAMALADRGETRKAIDELRIALSIDPYSYEAHSNLGTIYSREGEYDRAVEQFQLAIAIFPDPFNPPPMEVMNVARAFYNMGLAYQQMGRFNSALQAYDKAIRVAPQMGEAYSNMGTVYFAMGRHAEAEMSFKKALSINPSLDLARKNLELLEGLTP
ncbi:tetratricopeptide repeat protein [Candidatus Poribacteria bacterium]|nr:tetratricopeptide repeat protein [Candidatus Poribacteria bacterium]